MERFTQHEPASAGLPPAADDAHHQHDGIALDVDHEIQALGGPQHDTVELDSSMDMLKTTQHLTGAGGYAGHARVYQQVRVSTSGRRHARSCCLDLQASLIRSLTVSRVIQYQQAAQCAVRAHCAALLAVLLRDRCELDIIAVLVIKHLARTQVRTGVREFFYEVRQDEGTLRRMLTRRIPLLDTLSFIEQPDARLSQLELSADTFCNSAIIHGRFVSGALGGMAALTLLEVFLFRISSWQQQTALLLQFYAPIALPINRVYFVLITLALAAAVSRYALPRPIQHVRKCAYHHVQAWEHGCEQQAVTRAEAQPPVPLVAWHAWFRA